GQRVVHEVDVAAGVRKPPEIQREEDDDQRSEPEARQREPDQAADACRHIQARARTYRGQQAQRYSECDRDERRGRRELERRGQALGDLDEDGTSGADRVARIAAEERAEPGPVLHQKRLIKAEVRAQTRELLRGEGGGRAEPGRDRVTGDEANEEEREQGDADQGRDGTEQSLREISAHASRSDRPLVICRPRSAGDRWSGPADGAGTLYSW